MNVITTRESDEGSVGEDDGTVYLLWRMRGRWPSFVGLSLDERGLGGLEEFYEENFNEVNGFK